MLSPGGSSSLQCVAVGAHTLKLDDCVVIRPQASSSGQEEVARIVSIAQAGADAPAQLTVAFFLRPEQVAGGRQPFHADKELIEGDGTALLPLSAVQARCRVHSLARFQQLQRVGPNDWFARYGYQVAQQRFVPQQLPVFCRCELPYNPDRFMVQCCSCLEWYHPECLKVSIRAVGVQSSWRCPGCVVPEPEEDAIIIDPVPAAAAAAAAADATAAAAAADTAAAGTAAAVDAAAAAAGAVAAAAAAAAADAVPAVPAPVASQVVAAEAAAAPAAPCPTAAQLAADQAAAQQAAAEQAAAAQRAAAEQAAAAQMAAQQQAAAEQAAAEQAAAVQRVAAEQAAAAQMAAVQAAAAQAAAAQAAAGSDGLSLLQQGPPGYLDFEAAGAPGMLPAMGDMSYMGVDTSMLLPDAGAMLLPGSPLPGQLQDSSGGMLQHMSGGGSLLPGFEQ